MAAMAVRFAPVLARSVSFVKQATPYLTFFVVVGSGPATTGGVFRHASLVIVRSVFLKTDLVFFRGLCFAAGSVDATMCGTNPSSCLLDGRFSQ